MTYNYNSTDLVKKTALTKREEFLLKDSKTFCIYPWIHLHAYPTGEAYPCCHAEMGVGQVGNCRENTLKEIWNSPAQKQLRSDMLTETKNVTCQRCYEQEESGFFSGRRSANKHHGHHIGRVLMTEPDGHLNHFGMTYWDIRFSNLCNLSCRSCGHIFSSSWYQDQAKLAGALWTANNTALNIAGRNKDDMWNQLIPHLDYVEQIYFAGGEPLMMEEHYRILDELERRGRFDVRLIYNTNFTHTRLKDREVFDYWRKFKSVAVGASLDAQGPRAEYIRKGTNWAQVERNRRTMLEQCPNVDFYISPTLSILNAHHLPDFHRSWVEQGLIRAQDLNVNILQDPAHLRIDIATSEYKEQIRCLYQDHLDWLRPQDTLNRATVGFESAINFMLATDNTALLPKFWAKTNELDSIRNENVLAVIPELKDLK
jgi:radical SAM protein with 4Fe4S-binding SPASM domain